MDPINVDFTGRGRDDGKKGVADVFIPPEHSGKKNSDKYHIDDYTRCRAVLFYDTGAQF